MKTVFFLEAKCGSTNKIFYPRYDYAADDRWVLTYGIENLSSGDSVASMTEIDISNARIGPQYKCPHCGNTSYVRCGNCGKLTCLKADSNTFKCAHCSSNGKITGSIEKITARSGNGQ